MNYIMLWVEETVELDISFDQLEHIKSITKLIHDKMEFLDDEEFESMIHSVVENHSPMIFQILCAILSATSLFLTLLIYYSLKRITMYEEIILQVNDKIEYVNAQLKLIDEKGTFQSDDEVGFFFEELKEIGKLLDNLFEEVEDDANSKKEEKEKE